MNKQVISKTRVFSSIQKASAGVSVLMSYKEKVITVKEALEFVKSDFQIITSLGGGEAKLFIL